jgi:hypothetical protein
MRRYKSEDKDKSFDGGVIPNKSYKKEEADPSGLSAQNTDFGMTT